jgi:hypothetical protein
VSRKLYFVLRKDLPGSKEIVERFNKEIRGMMADGSYHRALDVDWIWVDIDGDGASELVLRGTRAGLVEPEASYDVISGGGYSDVKPPPQYVVNGVKYENWESVPDQYKVKVDRSSTYAEPVFPVFRF